MRRFRDRRGCDCASVDFRDRRGVRRERGILGSPGDLALRGARPDKARERDVKRADHACLSSHPDTLATSRISSASARADSTLTAL